MANQPPNVPWSDEAESVLVVAHPDDEALWFSAAARAVDRILICFAPHGASPAQAETVVREFPLANAEFLSLAGFGGYCRRHFAFPIRTSAGLLLWRRPWLEGRYRRNARRLAAELGERISSGSTVITHSPWGDYGHEEHVQVHTVLSGMRDALSLRIWHTNYATNKSLPLLRRSLFRTGMEHATVPTDPELLAKMREFYVRQGVWTWREDWTGFESETYIHRRLADGLPAYTRVPPINLFKLEY